MIIGDNMTVRIYVRASTKEQDAERALDDLVMFSKKYGDKYVPYVENHTGTKLERPELTKLLNESNNGDILLVASVDRLSRLKQDDFEKRKVIRKDKGPRMLVADLPTTQIEIKDGDDTTGSVLELINKLLIDLLATMARLDNEKRKERIKQGLARSGYKPTGKKADTAKHERIKAMLATGAMTKEEVAKAVGVGIATVYRVAKGS